MTSEDFERATLTRAQRTLLEALGRSDLGESFALSGGAALAAFYLRHRTSRDLDLFTEEDVPLESLRAFLASIPSVTVKSFQRLYDRRIFLLDVANEALEVEFTKSPFRRVVPPRPLTVSLRIEDPKDLAANKVAALADRRDPKDEVDLYFLLRSGSVATVEEAVRLAEQKFQIPGLRYLIERRLLAISQDHPPTSPLIEREEIVRTFRDAAKALVAGDIE